MKPSEILKTNLLEIIALFKKYEPYGFVNPRIYGSVARGEDTEDSDVDFVVDYHESALENILNLLDLSGELRRILNIDFDLVIYSDLIEPFQRSVDREAVPLTEFLT